MSAEAQTTLLETLQEPINATLAREIAYGAYVPTYGEFLLYSSYVDDFRPSYSSMNNGSPRIYAHREPDGTLGAPVSAEEHAALVQATQPGHWLLSEDDRWDIDFLLAAQSLSEVSGPSRHYNPTPEEAAEELRTRQGNARRHLALDRDIRDAQYNAELAQVWANSHHGARFNLQGTTPNRETIDRIAAMSLQERLTYVAPAPRHPDDEERHYVSLLDTPPAPTEAPVRGLQQRLKDLGRRIINLF